MPEIKITPAENSVPRWVLLLASASIVCVLVLVFSVIRSCQRSNARVANVDADKRHVDEQEILDNQRSKSGLVRKDMDQRAVVEQVIRELGTRGILVVSEQRIILSTSNRETALPTDSESVATVEWIIELNKMDLRNLDRENKSFVVSLPRPRPYRARIGEREISYEQIEAAGATLSRHDNPTSDRNVISGFERAIARSKSAYNKRYVGAKSSPLFIRAMAFERAMNGTILEFGNSPTEQALKSLMSGSVLTTSQIRSLALDDMAALLSRKSGMSRTDALVLLSQKEYGQAQAELTRSSALHGVMKTQAVERLAPIRRSKVVDKLEALGISSEYDKAVALSALTLIVDGNRSAAFRNLGGVFASLGELSENELIALQNEASATTAGLGVSPEEMASFVAERFGVYSAVTPSGNNAQADEKYQVLKVLRDQSSLIAAESGASEKINDLFSSTGYQCFVDWR